VKNCVIWGNHSSTQYPDVNHASVLVQSGSKTVRAAVQDDNWLNNDFIKVKKIILFLVHLFWNIALLFLTKTSENNFKPLFSSSGPIGNGACEVLSLLFIHCHFLHFNPFITNRWTKWN